LGSPLTGGTQFGAQQIMEHSRSCEQVIERQELTSDYHASVSLGAKRCKIQEKAKWERK
jgi:hypothetical protein